jgi:hypothetical protein
MQIRSRSAAAFHWAAQIRCKEADPSHHSGCSRWFRELRAVRGGGGRRDPHARTTTASMSAADPVLLARLGANPRQRARLGSTTGSIWLARVFFYFL